MPSGVPSAGVRFGSRLLVCGVCLCHVASDVDFWARDTLLPKHEHQTVFMMSTARISQFIGSSICRVDLNSMPDFSPNWSAFAGQVDSSKLVAATATFWKWLGRRSGTARELK